MTLLPFLIIFGVSRIESSITFKCIVDWCRRPSHVDKSLSVSPLSSFYYPSEAERSSESKAQHSGVFADADKSSGRAIKDEKREKPGFLTWAGVITAAAIVLYTFEWSIAVRSVAGGYKNPRSQACGKWEEWCDAILEISMRDVCGVNAPWLAGSHSFTLPSSRSQSSLFYRCWTMFYASNNI